MPIPTEQGQPKRCTNLKHTGPRHVCVPALPKKGNPRSFNGAKFQPLHRRQLFQFQHPTSQILNLLPLRRVWNIASPVLRLGKCVGLLAILVGAIGQVCAQTTRTWDGGTSGTSKAWSTAANWVGDVNPSSGDNLLFDNVNVAASIPSPLTVSGTSTFGLITFDNVNNKLRHSIL